MLAFEETPALLALDQADNELRHVYEELATDPDLAEERAEKLRALQALRLELARRVGLAALARYRATKSVAVVGGTDGQGSASERAEPTPSEPAPEPREATPALPASVEPPISHDALAAWTQTAKANGIGRAGYSDIMAPDAWISPLEKLMGVVGAPRDLDVEMADELAALQRVSDDEHINAWGRLPRHVQKLWLSMLVARTRAAKALRAPETRDRLKVIIGRYPPWAKRFMPGHVNGLQVDHEPTAGSWREDAREGWSSLQDLLEATPPAGPTMGARSALKPRTKAVAPKVEDDAHDSRIDPAWPLWPLVRGKSALLVGGGPREPSRIRLERAFEFASLDWPDIAGPRKVASIVSRIQQRNTDLVLVLKGLVDHKQSDPIVAEAKSAGVRWAMAESYGVTAVKMGIERYLGVRGANQ